MKRDFEKWFSSMKDSVATWNYYTDFNKVYKNLDKVKVELNILNSLIGSKNIKQDFIKLVKDYPNVIKVIPILLAKRETEIKVNDVKQTYRFNFINMNYSIEQYALFMENSGIFSLIQNHIISNLVDYVQGIEVGMDTNARKNRTGHVMEDLIESYLRKARLVINKTYFKQMYSNQVEDMFKLNLSSLTNKGNTPKKFDFVFLDSNKTVYAAECNFYSSSGSKLNETARSYKTLALESKGIKNFKFVWFTDGIGWNDAKNNLKETFDVLDNIYNINDLEEGAIERLVNFDKKILSLVDKE